MTTDTSNSSCNEDPPRRCTCKPRTTARFGLKYIVETPKKYCAEPCGYQIEINATPSKIGRLCDRLMNWVNCPPVIPCAKCNRDQGYCCCEKVCPPCCACCEDCFYFEASHSVPKVQCTCCSLASKSNKCHCISTCDSSDTSEMESCRCNTDKTKKKELCYKSTCCYKTCEPVPIQECCTDCKCRPGSGGEFIETFAKTDEETKSKRKKVKHRPRSRKQQDKEDQAKGNNQGKSVEKEKEDVRREKLVKEENKDVVQQKLITDESKTSNEKPSNEETTGVNEQKLIKVENTTSNKELNIDQEVPAEEVFTSSIQETPSLRHIPTVQNAETVTGEDNPTDLGAEKMHVPKMSKRQLLDFIRKERKRQDYVIHPEKFKEEPPHVVLPERDEENVVS